MTNLCHHRSANSRCEFAPRVSYAQRHTVRALRTATVRQLLHSVARVLPHAGIRAVRDAVRTCSNGTTVLPCKALPLIQVADHSCVLNLNRTSTFASPSSTQAGGPGRHPWLPSFHHHPLWQHTNHGGRRGGHGGRLQAPAELDSAFWAFAKNGVWGRPKAVYGSHVACCCWWPLV